MRKYFVYMLSSIKGTLYTGVTNDLERRIWEHKTGANAGFTSKYKINLLVYYEEFDSIEDAIIREKQIKGLRRQKKRALVELVNPKWLDLSEGWD
jgi:putative endonuclease